MSQQPEPLSPEDRERIVALASASREMPKASAAVGRLLTLADSLAARVCSLEARWRTFQSESAQLTALQALREKAQEARRAVDRWWPTVYYPPQPYERAVKAAIDALVPPVPAAPPENEKEARSVRTEANAPDVRLPCCGFKMGWCRCNP